MDQHHCYFGLTEALLWPQEGVDDNSTPQTYRNTPWSSLNLSLSDDGNVSKGQTTLGKMVEDPQSDVREPVMETRNQGCVTNMVRAGTDITKYGRGTTRRRTDQRMTRSITNVRLEGPHSVPDMGTSSS